jgi:hypothetical protein
VKIRTSPSLRRVRSIRDNGAYLYLDKRISLFLPKHFDGHNIYSFVTTNRNGLIRTSASTVTAVIDEGTRLPLNHLDSTRYFLCKFVGVLSVRHLERSEHNSTTAKCHLALNARSRRRVQSYQSRIFIVLKKRDVPSRPR